MADEKHPAPQNQGSALLADLCNEAVALFGSDRNAIERHVSDRLEGMSVLERTHLLEMIGKILEFRAPNHYRDGMH